ncbi:putative bifunctional diguanylate cyclase/phosphodiesterase, partial [Micromonospora sp. NPDC003776]
DTPARISGDEFAVLLASPTTPGDPVTVVNRTLATAAATPLRFPTGTVTIRASAGVAGGAGDDPEDVLHRADIALYHAKRAGTHGVILYRPGMLDQRADDAALGDDLDHAVTDGQLAVLFQPMVDLRDGHPGGVEALVRWRHPTRGLVSPLTFIPVAERTGAITAIGLYVLEQACRAVHSWQADLPDRRSCYASVNVAPRQLQERTLVDDVLAILDRTGLPPTDLVLEVTESALVDGDPAIPTLAALRRHGIRIAVDDFGTGYSSLHYLARLPVDILKIDRSFVAELDDTPAGAAITEAIIRLSQALHLTTVAEGIETPAQATELTRLGCHTGQGYLYTRPLPADDARRYLTTGITPPAAGRPPRH